MIEIKIEENSLSLICLQGSHYMTPGLLLVQSYRIWDQVFEISKLTSKRSLNLENKYIKAKLMYGIKENWKIKVIKSPKRNYHSISIYENSLLFLVLGYLVKKFGC